MAAGNLILGDGSGGGAGGTDLFRTGNAGNGAGSADTISGTLGNDVIFGDGAGGGGINGGFSSASVAGDAGSGADFISAGAGDDILFGDNFNGEKGAAPYEAGSGGLGGGGGAGGSNAEPIPGSGGFGAGNGRPYDNYSAGLPAADGTPGGNPSSDGAGSGGGGLGGGVGGTAGKPAISGSDGNDAQVFIDDTASAIYNEAKAIVDAGNIGSTDRTSSGEGSGDDSLDGEAGSDDYFGQGGADIFIIDLNQNTGNDVDTLWDFDSSEGDMIDLRNNGTSFNAACVDDLLANNTELLTNVDETGGHTHWTFNNNAQLIIKNTLPADLNNTHFVTGTLGCDITPPTIIDILRSNPTDENIVAGTLVFSISFDEAVTDVSIDDFIISGGATSGSSISSVTGSSSNYTITVDVPSSNAGELTLNVIDTNDIVDLQSNSLASVTPTGSHQSYTLTAAESGSSSGAIGIGVGLVLVSLLIFRKIANSRLLRS